MKLLQDLRIVPKKHIKSSGHPGDKTLGKLTIKYMHMATNKDYWSCIAVNAGCLFLRASNPQKNRILPYVADCQFLSNELKVFDGDTAANMSLGAKLVGPVQPPVAPSASQKQVPTEYGTRSEVAGIRGPVPSKLEVDVTTARKKVMQDKIDHCIMKLICVNGLVPNILDSENWAELMSLLNHRYKVTCAKEFTTKIIPNKAALVQKLTLARLQKEQNLMLTFDGNSTCRLDSVYFMHVTTKDQDSYFINGYKGSDEWHTAEWVKDKIIKVFTPMLSFLC
jgi:hypothetical protein